MFVDFNVGLFGLLLLDLEMDVRDMNAFQTASFDAVIDKGTSLLSCLA